MRSRRAVAALAALAALTPVAAGATTAPDGRTLTPAGTVYTTTGDFPAQAVLGTGPLGRPTLMVTDTGQNVNDVESFDAVTPAVHSAVAGTATLPPGFNAAPWANSGSIALSPGGTIAYDGGGETQTVRAFSVGVPTAQTATYPIGAFAGNVAVSNDGARLYVSQTFDGSQHFGKGHTIVEYTIAGGTTRTAAVGRDPEDIAVAPPTAPSPALAVVNRDDASVTVLSPATLTPLATVAVDRQPATARFTPDGRRLLVLCSLDDSIVVIDTTTWTPLEHISLRPISGIGAGPSDLAIDPATATKAYVALSADNAITVLQRPSASSDAWLLAGKIPTARYPTGVVVDDQDQQLLVTDGKGAATPTAGGDTPGAVEAIPFPSAGTLASSTAQVEQNNSGAPQSCVSPGVAAISHVVYIIRENKTYDEEFGDMPGGNPAFLMYGNANTPNTHALANRFALMENFNTNQEVSDTGHEVVMGSVANDFMERNVQQSYGLDGVPRQGPELGGDADTGWSPTNYLLDSAVSANLDFRDYGEFYRRDQSVGTPTEDQAVSAALDSHIVHGFPGFGFDPNTKDTTRFAYWNAQFQQDGAANHMPQLEVLYLPEDHTDSSKGVSPQQQVADSDLATGQIVDALSHSQFWDSTAVFLTEDDPQSGMDHIDYHRTIGLVAGPHVKAGYQSTTHFDQAGMLRTIEEILGLPPLTEHDATATPLDELFTAVPNDTPYSALAETFPSPAAAVGVAAQYAATFGAGADPTSLPPAKQFAFQWQMTHNGSAFTPPATSPGNDLAAPAPAGATACVPGAVLGETPLTAAASVAGVALVGVAAIAGRRRRGQPRSARSS